MRCVDALHLSVARMLLGHCNQPLQIQNSMVGSTRNRFQNNDITRRIDIHVYYVLHSEQAPVPVMQNASEL